MLLARTLSYLNSVLWHKYLILDNYHPDILYLRQQGCDDLLMVIRRIPNGLASKEVWETLSKRTVFIMICFLVPG